VPHATKTAAAIKRLIREIAKSTLCNPVPLTADSN